MSMTFEVSSHVTLLFDFWKVDGPAGMVLSVFVVLLVTVFYELLKVWRVWLSTRSKLARPQVPYAVSTSHRSDGDSIMNSAISKCSLEQKESHSQSPKSTPSECSLAPMESHSPSSNTRNSWLLHGTQTLLHMVQVILAYVVMMFVMSCNAWIFIGVIVGSGLGYFISFPLLGQN